MGNARRMVQSKSLGVSRVLAEHRGGGANHARALWPLVVLQAWIERWRPDLDSHRAPASVV